MLYLAIGPTFHRCSAIDCRFQAVATKSHMSARASMSRPVRADELRGRHGNLPDKDPVKVHNDPESCWQPTRAWVEGLHRSPPCYVDERGICQDVRRPGVEDGS